MKLQPDRLDVQSILGYGPGWVGLGREGVAEKIEHSVVIGSRGEKFDWKCARFEQLTAEHFALLAETRPELVIFGSGARLRFVRTKRRRAPLPKITSSGRVSASRAKCSAVSCSKRAHFQSNFSPREPITTLCSIFSATPSRPKPTQPGP